MSLSTSAFSRASLTLCLLVFCTSIAIPQTVYRARYYPKARAIVELKLDDTVTPEFIRYHFRRFGYQVLDANIHRVEAVIHGSVSEDDLVRITYHPFVDEIVVAQEFGDPENPTTPSVAIKFKHEITDAMILRFLAIHSGFDIELHPREAKKVVIRTAYWTQESLVENLEALIYVQQVTLLPSYP